MSGYRFLTLDEVRMMHATVVGVTGGATECPNPGLLESAVGMPRQTFGGHYLHADVFEMAAAYLFHIVQNHPFSDGNKRTGAMAALLFLELNGVTAEPLEDAYFTLVMAVATGDMEKGEVAAFFRELAHP